MKIKHEDYTELKELCTTYVKEHPGIRESYKLRGLSDSRYVWDVLWYSEAHKIVNRLGKYLHDSHIETALKAILL